jgi:hypothetical protein
MYAALGGTDLSDSGAIDLLGYTISEDGSGSGSTEPGSV